MSIRSLTLPILSALLMLSGLTAASHESGEVKSLRNLALSVHVDKAEYSLGDDIEIKVELANDGKQPVTVFGLLKWGHRGGLVLNINESGTGRKIEPRFYDDSTVHPGLISEPKNYVTITPEHFFGCVRKDRVRDLVPSTGEYEVWVEYLAPISRGEAGGSSVLVREDGSIRSERIRFSVK